VSDKDKRDGFNYQLIKPDLLSLFEGIATNLERDTKYPTVDSANAVLSSMVKINVNTYGTVMFICSDVSKDPALKPEFTYSIPPLVRTIYESLVSIIFILEDVPSNIKFFLKTGYVERQIELNHCQKYYGMLPEWKNYIDAQRAQIIKEEIEFQLSAAEIANPKKTIGRWPTPGGVLAKLRKQYSSSSAVSFIEYMNSWLYSDLSGLTHLNSPGFIQRSMPFLHPDVKKIVAEATSDETEKTKEKHWREYRMKHLLIAIGLMLALMSELQVHFQYGFKDRIKLLWGIFNELDDRVKEIHNRRYASLLA
jgi:hypothetical protein